MKVGLIYTSTTPELIELVEQEVKKQLDEVLAHFPPVEEALTDEERFTAALALTAALPERVFTGRYDQLMGAEEAPPAAG